MMRRKIYDAQGDCLVYLDREATESFWDEKWEASANAVFANPPRHGQTIRITRSYLQPGARVLEGGCGLGDVVHALWKAGYVVDGIDYAPKVVQAINCNWPELNVIEGDVRHLPWEDGFYDGYWSLGVIEHFIDGYDAITCEMHRVLRPGGYLFVSFPSFNPFRKSRAAAGKYPEYVECSKIAADFFQYALNPLTVQSHFERLGFDLVEKRGIGSLQGLAEEWRFIASVMGYLDKFPSRVTTAISMALDLLIGSFAGHSCLLILRKK